MKVSFLTSKVSATDKMFFARYLALMLKAGIPLSKALELLEAQTENKALKHIIVALGRDVASGVSMGEALEKHPVFGPLFVNMVKSGEISGNLEEVLEIISEEIRKSEEMRSRVKGALVYPCLVLGLTVVVCLFIVFFVFPKIIKIYEALNVEVPLTTQILISVVKFSSANALWIVAVLIVLIAAATIFLKAKIGKRIFDKMILKLPIAGGISQKINIVQFSRTLASLLHGGVAITNALDVTAKTVGNSLYSRSLQEMSKGVKQGKQLNEIARLYPDLYPRVVIQMITIGEQTGGLTDILAEIAKFFGEELDKIMANLAKVIEPILMVTMGVIVGFVAIATVQLIYSSLQSGAI